VLISAATANPNLLGHLARRSDPTGFWCISWRPLLKLGARGEFHLEGRALANCRLNPDAAAVHLDDLLGNGETKPGAALGLGVGAVDLMELLEDAGLVFDVNARHRIGDADSEVTVHSLGGDTNLAAIGELNCVPYKVKQNLLQALLVAKADGQGLGHVGLESEILVLRFRG
jgi:hypothetical protein